LPMSVIVATMSGEQRSSASRRVSVHSPIHSGR
jgi:hypothetical protein